MDKVLLIGIGEFGRNHLRTLKELGYNVITVDNNKKANYSNYKEIDISEVIAAVVATNASSHYEICKYLLEKRCPTLVEKPMTLDYNQALELVNISEYNNIIFAVGHIFRYHPLTDRLIMELKRIICKEKQKIRAIRSQRIGLHSPRTDCNVLWDFGIHDIDLIQYIFRSVSPVMGNEYLNPSASYGRILTESGVEDISTLVYSQDGIYTQIDVDWISPIKNRTLTFICSDETLEADYVKEELRIHKSGLLPISKEEGEARFNIKTGDTIIPKIEHFEPLKIEIEDFINSVKKHYDPLNAARTCLIPIKLLSEVI